MADRNPCPNCRNDNEAGARFCATCGASLATQIHCPSCNALNPLGNRFCTVCGGSLEHAGWAGSGEAATGAVVDGTWQRGADEIIRRVDPEDARRFLGTRTVRVPAGTVGVILVDGVVERVLPPGERTTLGLFERIANFFLRRERTAFYLVDQRPFPVPFVLRSRPNAAGRSVKTQVLVTFTLPKGDKQALASFIANVLGERPVFAAGDLYNLLRPEVVRTAEAVLERAGDDISYPDAEAAIRSALAGTVAARYGLTVDATLAPLTAIASLTLHLGTGVAPKVRPCASCRHELPVSLRFCDACGAKQPAVTTGAGPDAPLFTADGQQLELDLVVRVQGQNEDFGPERIGPALAGAAAAHLRDTAFTSFTSGDGFTRLEQALTAAAGEALASFGLTLVALSVVDVRSKTGQWLLAARADLDRAHEDVKLGRSWLDQRDSELDLEEMTVARVLRQKTMERDSRLHEDAAALADRERREELADRDAALVAGAARREREHRLRETAERRDDARQELAFAGETTELDGDRQRRAAQIAADVHRTAVASELDALRGRRDLDFQDLERRRKLEIELKAAEENVQLDKLRAMAALDRQMAAQEQAHEIEKRAMLKGLATEDVIALQAGELARSEGGGAAWANVLSQKLGAETERKHAEEVRALLERQQAGSAALYQTALGAMSEVARSRAEAAPVVAGGGGVTVGSIEAGPVTKPCKSCSATLRAEAKFCGACGAQQG